MYFSVLVLWNVKLQRDVTGVVGAITRNYLSAQRSVFMTGQYNLGSMNSLSPHRNVFMTGQYNLGSMNSLSPQRNVFMTIQTTALRGIEYLFLRIRVNYLNFELCILK